MSLAKAILISASGGLPKATRNLDFHVAASVCKGAEHARKEVGSDDFFPP